MVFASHSAVKFAVPVSVFNVGCIQSAGDVVIFSANEETEKNEIKIAKQIVPICLKLSNKLHVCVSFWGFQPIRPFFTHNFWHTFPFP